MSANNSFTQFSDELAAMVEKAGGSVALVNARRRLPASGIVYAPDLVLTADHVIEREEDLSVVLVDGLPIPASLAGRDPGRDLALLRLSQSSAVPFTPAEGSPKVGQIAVALARPDAEGIQASLGIVSAVGGPARTGRGAMLEQYLRADIVPYPGFSGGALVDAAGKLLGLNTSGLAMGTLITIPTALAWQAAATLAAHGHIRRAYLGVRSQLVTLAPAQKTALGREQETALLLVGVEADTPASKAGLQAGDILAGLAGQPLADPEALQVALGSQEAGKESSVEILRGEKRMQVKVTLQNGADGKSAIRVWIAAPSPAVRVGLRTLLESAPGLRVTTETARLPESGYFPDSPVDVVVLAASGGRITLPEDFPWPVLLLVQEAPPGRVLPAAVRAVLGLEAAPEELAAAVQAVHAGLWAAAPGMLPPPWQPGSFESTLDDDFEGEKLTGRELEVLAAMGRGFTNRQIAAALVISENTVKFHVSSIYAKLGAGNRAEAIRLAARRGLLVL